MFSFISVIVPVYREQGSINDFLTHIGHVFSGAGYEIIVVDGSPGRETLAAVHDPGIKAVPSDSGRSRQMNHGASVAQGDILLFVHADTRLPDHAPDVILQAMADEKNVGGAFSLGIDSRDPLLRLIAFVANLRTRWTRVPYGDQTIFMRPEYFQEIGMFPDIPLMEDLELMHRVKRRGWRIVILPQRVLTSPRRWLQEGKLKGTLRNWVLRILYHCGVPAEKLAGYYKVANKSKGS
ncbi:MAG: TIGR04283 family arsenosugar biosynthesis glycosyltransferase [Desulfovermiculus sp.]|nr:TIGR04283 family arsenosugar biosynthesis glycosyltransferase [Desulfovermiculus sp.]